MRVADMERVLRWERAAQTRWGAYITNAEHLHLQRRCRSDQPELLLTLAVAAAGGHCS